MAALILPDQFLNWQMVDGTKVPVDRHGRNCDPHDPSKWMSHAEAVATGRPVAWSLQDHNGMFFMDLDKCRMPDGQWRPEAVEIFGRFVGAWGEVSTSGNGLHILGHCQPALLKDRKRRWDEWLECYTGGRFIAFGQGWAPIGGVATGADFTSVLQAMLPLRPAVGDLPDGVDPAYTGPADDEALLALALRSRSAGAAFGSKITFEQLWRADPVALMRFYPNAAGGFDHSAADAALMAQLAFWTGKDAARMDRLFRRSGLMRAKYETRADYRSDTITGARATVKSVYSVEAGDAGGASGAGGDAAMYALLPDMIERFKGCVYVRDVHRILVPGGAMLKPEQFNATFGGYVFQMQANGQKPSTKAFEAFTECRMHTFPKVATTIFDPRHPAGAIIGDAVNVYVRPDIDRTPGDVNRFLDFLRRLLPVQGDREIMLAWMAAMVQYPGVKFQWAPVVQGCEGNGKTMLFSVVRYAVGEQFTFSPRASGLVGQFDGYQQFKLFILVEEVHMQGRRDVLDDLKPKITNEVIQVEAKGKDQQMIRNVANWAFCTNYKDAVLKSKGDRRYAVFFSAQQSPEDIARDGMGGEFFPAMYQWLRSGGYAAMAAFLEAYPIPAHLNPAGACHRAPVTSSTNEAIEHSKGAVESEIVEAAQDGTKGFCGGWISFSALTALMKDRGIKISRHRLVEILTELGYREWGRAPRGLMVDNGKRPILYRNEPGGTFEDFLRAQAYTA